MARYAFFQGQIVPIEEAKVSIRTQSFNYGTGVFAGLRGYWNSEHNQLYLFRPKDHFKRLLDACRMLFMVPSYSIDELTQITIRLLRAEAYREDCYCRPLIYFRDEVVGAKLIGLQNELAMYSEPFGQYLTNEEGLHVMISSWRRVDDNAIPARGKIIGTYVNSAMIKSEAILAGCDDAIVLTQEGHVSESSAANLFMLRDGRLSTPPITDNILEGITRRTLIELVRNELDIPVDERPIDRSELYLADEMFLCGTGVQIGAIIEVDKRSIGTGKMGPLVKDLRQLYFKVVRAQEKKYSSHWCVPVYPNAAEYSQMGGES